MEEVVTGPREMTGAQMSEIGTPPHVARALGENGRVRPGTPGLLTLVAAALAPSRRWAVSLLSLLIASVAVVGLSAGTASAAKFEAKNTAELEQDIETANTNAQANQIVLSANTVYLPAKTLTLTDKSGQQTIEGPEGHFKTPPPPGTEISGANVIPEGNELLVVGEGVSAALKWVAVSLSGGLGNPAVEVKHGGNLMLEEAGLDNNNGNALAVPTGASATIVNSTLSYSSTGEGLVVTGTATLINSTVAFNETGGIFVEGTVNLTNTIVADNTRDGFTDCNTDGLTLKTNADHSLDSDGTCDVGALSSMNPEFEKALNFDGGPTRVQSLLAGSPAINAGDPAQCTAIDQRGAKRPTGECDIGADQFSTTPPVLTVPEKIEKPAESSSGASVEYTVEASQAEGAVEGLTCVAPATKKSYPVSNGTKQQATFPIGTTQVTCTAINGHEIKAEAPFEVVITPQIITTTTTSSTTSSSTTSSTTTSSTTSTTSASTTTPTTTSTSTTTSPTTTSSHTTTSTSSTTPTTSSSTTTTSTITPTTTTRTTTTPSSTSTVTSTPTTSSSPTTTTSASTSSPSSSTTSSTTTTTTTSTRVPPETPAAELRRVLGELQSAKLPRRLRQQLSRLLSAALHDLEALESHAPPPSAVRAAALGEWSLLQEPLAPLASVAKKGGAKGPNSHERTLQQACNALTQFIALVNANDHGHKPKIPASLGKSWIAAVRKIEASAGCSSLHKSTSRSSGHSHRKSSGHSRGH
jgi:hypothetical protein